MMNEMIGLDRRAIFASYFISSFQRSLKLHFLINKISI